MPIPMKSNDSSYEEIVRSKDSHSVEDTGEMHELRNDSAAQRQNLHQLQLQNEDHSNRKSNNEEHENEYEYSNEIRNVARSANTLSALSQAESSSDNCHLSMHEPISNLDEQDKKSKRKCAKNIPFPKQLHEILTNKAHSGIISWLPHGKAFIVLDKKKFVEVVSKKYFKETKYESFTRKLNRWNFVRISRGPDTGAFQHEFFLRDDVPKSSEIICQKKHERKTPRTGISKKKRASTSALDIGTTAFPIQNELPSNDPRTLSFPNSLSTLDAIKKAQIEQLQRRQLLNYLSLKQQFDIWRNKELYLRSQMPSNQNQQHTAHSSNESCKKQIKSIPDIPRLQDVNPLDFSSLMLTPKINDQVKLQPLSKMSPITLKKNASVPVLPNMPSIPIQLENDDWKMKHPFEVKKVGSQLKIASISKKPATPNQPQLKDEDNKLSVLVDAATRVPLSSKEFDIDDSTKCNLPPKKKFQRRLSDDDGEGSVHSSSGSVSSKEPTPIIERATAA